MIARRQLYGAADHDIPRECRGLSLRETAGGRYRLGRDVPRECRDEDLAAIVAPTQHPSRR